VSSPANTSLLSHEDLWGHLVQCTSFHIPPFLILPLAQDGLLLLAEKLQGPFSFELAAESIGVRISEGLMHLQENSVKVAAKVWGGEGGGEAWGKGWGNSAWYQPKNRGGKGAHEA
jgi:hypothetical protein